MSVVERERVEEVVAPKEVTEADVLTRAADLLEEFGWCQHAFSDVHWTRVQSATKMCAVGAITRARLDLGEDHTAVFGLTPDAVEVHRFATRVLEFGGTDNCFSVPTWNDTPGRTKAEVVARLRSAAEAARS